MKSKIFATALMVALLAAAIAAPAGLAAKPKKAAAGPLEIGTDPAGDWGANADPSIGPLGDALGLDLTTATLEMADAATVNFIIGVNSLPPSGGVPEVARYTWNFNVGDEAFQLSGAFTEYARGICNPTTPNSCPPPRDPGMSPFFLRSGSCLVGEECIEEGLVHATFDAASATITIPVPLEMIRAKNGSKIIPGVTNFGGTIYAVPAAFVTNASMPFDTLTASKTFVVSSKAKKK
jgi:hypothetical protein